MNKEDPQIFLTKFDQEFSSSKFGEFHWEKAICYILLGNLEKAILEFQKSFSSMLEPPMFWKKSGQPDNLAEVFILACKFDKKDELLRILANYRENDNLGDSSYSHRAYGLIGLLYPELNWAEHSAEKLTEKKKFQVSYQIGICIQAIRKKDNGLLEKAIYRLLDAHKNVATHGSLRGIPEGWLCMPAITLGFLAEKSGMDIKIENEFFSQTYIDFMFSNVETG